MDRFNADRVTRVLDLYGYTEAMAAEGLKYAREQQADSDNLAFCLALARILYDDHTLAEFPAFDADIDEAEADDE